MGTGRGNGRGTPSPKGHPKVTVDPDAVVCHQLLVGSERLTVSHLPGCPALAPAGGRIHDNARIGLFAKSTVPVTFRSVCFQPVPPSLGRINDIAHTSRPRQRDTIGVAVLSVADAERYPHPLSSGLPRRGFSPRLAKGMERSELYMALSSPI